MDTVGKVEYTAQCVKSTIVYNVEMTVLVLNVKSTELCITFERICS